MVAAVALALPASVDDVPDSSAVVVPSILCAASVANEADDNESTDSCESLVDNVTDSAGIDVALFEQPWSPLISGKAS